MFVKLNLMCLSFFPHCLNLQVKQSGGTDIELDKTDLVSSKIVPIMVYVSRMTSLF